jgi:K+-transporting ATPase c subunit
VTQEEAGSSPVGRPSSSLNPCVSGFDSRQSPRRKRVQVPSVALACVSAGNVVQSKVRGKVDQCYAGLITRKVECNSRSRHG